MQTIKLHLNFSLRQKYTIHLGNVGWLSFKSKRFADDFLRQYKSLLTDNVRYLISYHSEINSLHKNFYLDLDFETSLKIKKQLHNFDNRLEYVFCEFSKGNANSMVFSNIDYCFACLIDSLNLLFDYAKRYKNYSLKNQSRSKIKILYNLEKLFDEDKHSLKINFDYRNNSIPLKIVKSKTA
ncbi:MAG: hypothetical protein HQ471_08640 [Flavobacteriales bacterium]|nr:hypothetical protein [Flavobacteriales bacterium]